MRVGIVRDGDALAALLPAWASLWQASGGQPLTLHPAWIDAWWRALGGEGELMIFSCSERDTLLGVWPLVLAPPRGGSLRVRELRQLGDGVIGARLALLATAGREDEVAGALCAAVAEEPGWDVLELALYDPAAIDELARRFAAHGRPGERSDVAGRLEVALSGEHGAEGRAWIAARKPEGDRRFVAAEGPGFEERVAGLLARAHEAGSGPTAEPAFLRFVEHAIPGLRAAGALRLYTAEDAPGQGALILTDQRRWIELLVTSPAVGGAIAPATAFGLERAVAEGADSFELSAVGPRGELEAGPRRAPGARLRVRNDRSGRISRGYSEILRRAGAVAGAARELLDTGRHLGEPAAPDSDGVPLSREAQAAPLGPVERPLAQVQARLARLREAAPEVLQRAVARVATFSRLHLYRGELFVRGGVAPPGVHLRTFTLGDYEGLADRAAFERRLGLVPAHCREHFRRGDMAVLAELDGAPAGILWCARTGVYVSDIGREVRPLSGECYIHDVYVPPEARGRALAKAMLDFLARELRGRDIYRAWALIDRANVASTRAFEKAAYASVADVIYARMGRASKLLVRPPDPEARAFLGLPVNARR